VLVVVLLIRAYIKRTTIIMMENYIYPD